jgi:hypothetical protein
LNVPKSMDSHSTPFARRNTWTVSPFFKANTLRRKAFHTVSAALEEMTSPSPHYSRGFVTLRPAQGPEPSPGTKPPRRQARRARGAVREGGILETVC